jgi:hypothetical protein
MSNLTRKLSYLYNHQQVVINKKIIKELTLNICISDI